MNYIIGLIAEGLLMMSLQFEKWNPITTEFEMEIIQSESEPLLRKQRCQTNSEYLEDFLSLTTTTMPPDFVPRCKDFADLYLRYISKQSRTRIEIPENMLKVLKEKLRKNQFKESTFMPAFEHCLKLFEANEF